MTFSEIVEQVRCELLHARAKFPENKNLTVALMEEVGELAAAQLEKQGEKRIQVEAIQVMALCFRIIQEKDSAL